MGKLQEQTLLKTTMERFKCWEEAIKFAAGLNNDTQQTMHRISFLSDMALNGPMFVNETGWKYISGYDGYSDRRLATIFNK